jgi:hypothetical protein
LNVVHDIEEKMVSAEDLKKLYYAEPFKPRSESQGQGAAALWLGR